MWKGVGEVKRDGGWIPFKTLKAVEDEYRHKFSNLGWEPCNNCSS